jgi:hypothetical protein
MAALTLQRCLHHADREAVARCPECGRFFCRECITEHDERIICASCLAKLSRVTVEPRRRTWWVGGILPVGRAAVGAVAAWFFFYLLGHFLLTIPTKFHTDFWKQDFFQTDDD